MKLTNLDNCIISALTKSKLTRIITKDKQTYFLENVKEVTKEKNKCICVCDFTYFKDTEIKTLHNIMLIFDFDNIYDIEFLLK